MRCPKCGYNSFESYDGCINCAKNLILHKSKYEIVPVVYTEEDIEQIAQAFKAKKIYITSEAFSFD